MDTYSSVIFIGDSHLRRLPAAGTRIPLFGDVQFWCKGGVGLNYLKKSVELVRNKSVERRVPCPEVVVVFIGGNDLDRWDCSPVRLAVQYAHELEELGKCGCKVVYLRQWPRPGARIGGINFQTNLNLFEHALAGALSTGVWVWDWDRSLHFTGSFFSRDGVHCQPFKYKKVGRYLAAASIAAVRSSR